ncbi:NusG domain II-containing protein [Paenibacillus sp. M1]|uniref:NusG domain II-containing protein n=1 Tax=Paenibacillus haidiansis TaxID=1574488 RepID=A0ABU7VTA6_9BACL
MLKLKRGDIWLIATLLLVGFLWLGLRELKEQNQVYDPGDFNAVITVDGQLYKKVPLSGDDEEIEIKTEFGHNILKKFNGGIQMIFADCPKKISMAMGFISRPNQTIICVPNRIYVEIVGNASQQSGGDEVDVYAR